jgi:hypothetical protein
MTERPECCGCDWPPTDYPEAPCNLGPVGCCEWADQCCAERDERESAK